MRHRELSFLPVLCPNVLLFRPFLPFWTELFGLQPGKSPRVRDISVRKMRNGQKVKKRAESGEMSLLGLKDRGSRVDIPVLFLSVLSRNDRFVKNVQDRTPLKTSREEGFPAQNGIFLLKGNNPTLITGLGESAGNRRRMGIFTSLILDKTVIFLSQTVLNPKVNQA